jgi:hypothetical protein
MKEVKSSNIEAIHHEGTTLSVRFKGGGIWDYADVPAGVHAEMLARHERGESVGQFFHQHVKCRYEAKKREQEK